MRHLFRLIAFFLFSVSFSLDAQQLITSYSVDQGLPQSTVTALYRDNAGYLWCGTGAGLGLYDGWEFHTPKSSGEKENPALKSTVRGIIPSTDQSTIWVGTESTLNQFDRYSYHILRSFDLVKQPGIGEVPIYANDTAVWAVCWSQGLYRVRIADGKATRLTTDGFRNQVGLAGDGTTIVFTDTAHQLTAYNVQTGILKKYRVPDALYSGEINCYKGVPGLPAIVLIGSTKGLWTVDITNGKMERFLLGDKMFADSTCDFRSFDFHPDGGWWFSIMDRGVFRYDPATRALRSCAWQQDGTYAGNLLDAPTSLVCDQYGVVWCGTDGAGLIKLLHSRVAFRSKFTDKLITDTCNWFTRSFYELSPGRYLVGSFRGGLTLVDHVKGEIKRVTSGPLWELTTPFFVTESGDGRLLVGTDRSVILLDTLKWESEEVDPGYEGESRYVGFVRLQSGQIIVYGNIGVKTVSLSPSPALSKPVGKQGNITSIIQLKDGRIVAATYYDGIQVMDEDLHVIHKYGYESEIGISTTSNIRGISEDASGGLWLGTESGLCLLGSDFRLKERFTVEDGLSDNTIYGLLPVNKITLILTTGHGVTLFNTADHSCRKLDGADGLPSGECNSGALLLARSGKVYIGTTAGFVIFNPGEPFTCYKNPAILVSYGNNEEEASGIIRESIVRDYGSGSIELNIWLTDFTFPQRVVFTRQLEGAEQAAITETGLRKLTYAALGSGFYSLLCSADVSGCGLTGMNKLLTIKIVPPFWMSGWFIGITSMAIVLLITLILFAVMRMNYQRKLRKLKMQQELDKVRQRISRDIHDEIGAGLTRIALSGELMSSKLSAGDVQHAKLKSIAGTARELSQSMKEVVWSVNPHYDSLDHMAAYFRSYVSGAAENADLRFRYVADENFPAEAVNPETRRNLLLILKETVSNSVKYSGATELRLEIHWAAGIFSMTISDNGKGFNLEGPSGVNSNGLRNIRQRAEACGCAVTISSSPGNGTNIQITGPIDKQ